MANIYKCAVLGAGGRGNDWCRNLSKHKECDLVAISDIDEGRLKLMGKKYNVDKLYTDYNELLEKESLDFVAIATPHYMHAPMTVAAANNDCHVFCEKPMAINLQQCDEMIIACRTNDVKLAIGFQHHYDGILWYLKEAVEGKAGDNGSLGRVTDIVMRGRHYRSEMYYLGSSKVDPKTGVTPGPWRGRWQTEGAGILINQAVHNMDAFQMIGGPIKSCNAYAKTISKDHKFIEVEDTVIASVEFENGALGSLILTSSNKKAQENSISIHGTDNYIEGSGGFCANFVTMDTRYKDEEDYEVPFYMDPRRNQLENFLDSISNDTEPMVNGEEGRKSIELIRAILISVQNGGKRVHFPVADSIQHPTVENVNRRAAPEF